MKACNKCGLSKNLDEYYKQSNCPDGTIGTCKVCYREKSRARTKKYHKEYPGRRRSSILMNKYGITLDTFNDMLKNQNYKCAVCDSTNPGPKGVFAVDHCHSTGTVRGLLCYLCNMGLGSFKDNPTFLMAAITYLKENGH